MTKLDEIKKHLADLEADNLTSTFELTGDMRALVDEVERLRDDGLRAEKDRQAIHEMLLRAGVPVATGAACDDPECQSQLQHRVGWLLDERDRLRDALRELHLRTSRDMMIADNENYSDKDKWQSLNDLSKALSKAWKALEAIDADQPDL